MFYEVEVSTEVRESMQEIWKKKYKYDVTILRNQESMEKENQRYIPS